jgi:hypothetical protein
MFYWRATYDNGETIEKGKYEDIDRERLRFFELLDEDGNVRVKVKLEKGQRLIWRKRVELTPGEGEKVVHLVGKQETVEEKNVQGLCLLYEDGTMEFFEKFNKEHPWLRPVVLLPEEK